MMVKAHLKMYIEEGWNNIVKKYDDVLTIREDLILKHQSVMFFEKCLVSGRIVVSYFGDI